MWIEDKVGQARRIEIGVVGHAGAHEDLRVNGKKTDWIAKERRREAVQL